MNIEAQSKKDKPVNISRALESMVEAGLDVLVATSPVNVTYFTGYSCWLGPVFREFMVRPGGSCDLLPTFAVFTAKSETALVVDGVLGLNAGELDIDEIYLTRTLPMEQGTPTEDLYAGEALLVQKFAEGAFAESAADGLAQALQARGLSDARIGLDSEFLSAKVRAQLTDLLPRASIRNCSNLLRLMRMVKSVEEARRMRRALEIAEVAAKEAFSSASVGQPLSQITQSYHESVTRLGGQFEHMAYGPRGAGITTYSSEALRSDDCFYADFGTVFEDYLSDTGFTFSVKPLSGQMLDKYQTLRDSIAETASWMRPGMRASEVAHYIKQYLAERGITETFPHGHGVGLEPRDYPILVPDTGLRVQDDCIDVPADLPLEEGMVLNLETPLFMPPEASLHVEQTFLLTATGAEPFVQQERKEPIRP